MRQEMRISRSRLFRRWCNKRTPAPPRKALRIFIIILLSVSAVCPIFYVVPRVVEDASSRVVARSFDLGGAILSSQNTRPRYAFYKRDAFLETFR